MLIVIIFVFYFICIIMLILIFIGNIILMELCILIYLNFFKKLSCKMVSFIINVYFGWEDKRM